MSIFVNGYPQLFLGFAHVTNLLASLRTQINVMAIPTTIQHSTAALLDAQEKLETT